MRLNDALLEYSSDALILTDLNAVIQQVNPAFTRMTGYVAKEVLGKKASCLKSGRHTPHFYLDLWHSLAASGRWQGEIWNRKKNGEVYLSWLTIITVTDKDGRPLKHVGIASDAPQGQADLGPARYLASHYDALTGLPNRFSLKDKILIAQSQARRRNIRFALIYLELEGIDSVNALLGYTVGDQLLQEIAERLKNRVRDIDTVAYMGVNRFVIIFTEIKGIDDIIYLARTILRWLEMPFSLQGHMVVVSPSMGVTLYPDDHSDPDELLVRAEAAMQRAKAAGKGRLCFYSEDMRPA